jgi:hypothetical protein
MLHGLKRSEDDSYTYVIDMPSSPYHVRSNVLYPVPSISANSFKA